MNYFNYTDYIVYICFVVAVRGAAKRALPCRIRQVIPTKKSHMRTLLSQRHQVLLRGGDPLEVLRCLGKCIIDIICVTSIKLMFFF
jgi:hypothetical protein